MRRRRPGTSEGYFRRGALRRLGAQRLRRSPGEEVGLRHGLKAQLEEHGTCEGGRRLEPCSAYHH